jgi:hypothetical protein
MCLNPSKDIHHYWAEKNQMYRNVWIKSQMNREQWQFIHSYLHFDVDFMVKHHEKKFEVKFAHFTIY